MLKLWSLFLLLIFICSCQSPVLVKDSANKAPQEVNFVNQVNFIPLDANANINTSTSTDTDSNYRPRFRPIKTNQDRMIRQVEYQLVFNLHPRGSFEVDSEISFYLANHSNDISIDLLNAKIKNIQINNKQIYPDYDGKRLKLSASLLKSGKNTLKLLYNGQYNQSGSGLNTWQDPTDNQIYVYSHIQQQGAGTLIPSFQQSGTLATFNLLVFAPSNWHVISTTKENKVPNILGTASKQKSSGQQNLWQFAESHNMKPENFALFAGPFHILESANDKTLLRFISPQSVGTVHQNEVNAIRWLNHTSQSLTSLSHFLSTKYPFYKYDQIWMPTQLKHYDNATAVTMLTDKEILESETDKVLQKSLITDTLAKQWFGHLINTPNWQHDWLNESLSQYVTSLIRLDNDANSPIWLNYYTDEKPIAYNQDRLNDDNLATSANNKQVNITQQKMISRIKGIALLKQLHFSLGEPAFRLMLKKYLTNFEYSNTSPTAFFSMLDQFRLEYFELWQQHWLQTPGINQINVDLQCTDGVISQLKLIQRPDKSKTLRRQKVNLALFHADIKGLHVKNVIPVTYQGQNTNVKDAINLACPDFIYANYQDFGYVEVNITSKEIKPVINHFNNIDDPLLSLMIWRSLWQSVLNGQLLPQDYLSIVLLNLPSEQNLQINRHIRDTLFKFNHFLFTLPIVNESYINKAAEAIAELSLQKVFATKDYPKLQKIWLDSYIAFANKTSHLDHLAYLLKNHDARLPKLSQTQRWNIIKQLNRYDYPQSTRLIENEAKKDPSMQGKVAKLLAYVVKPVATEKRHTLESLTRLPAEIQRQVMANIYPPEQGLLRAATVEERLAFITKANDKIKNHPHFFENYSQYLTPDFCIKELRNNLNFPLKNPLPPKVRKNIEQKRLEISQCIKIKQQLKNGI